MTVKEMKKVLENLPNDAELFGSDGHNWYPLGKPPVEYEIEGEKCIVFYPPD